MGAGAIQGVQKGCDRVLALGAARVAAACVPLLPPKSYTSGGSAHSARHPAFCDGALHPGHRAGRGAPPGAAAHFRLLQGGAGTRCNFNRELWLRWRLGTPGSPSGLQFAPLPPL